MASSAAAFVEGGVQDACEDACSICLESFGDADPAVITCCKHEYHLQCIIEWSQRSKECPMCWQALSLKDPNSQELLAAVEHERAIRQSRIGVFPPEGYELHRLAAYGDDSDFEERMMRHLTFVTMGRRQLGRRDGNANAASVRPPYGNMPQQFVIVPAHGNAPSSGAVSVPAGSLSLSPSPPSVTTSALHGSPVTPDSGSSSVDSSSLRSRGSPRVSFTAASTADSNRRSPETHSFSESWKSRWAAASSRYKESFTKTTKSFRDKLRMRNGSTMADFGARAREVSAGMVRALERISVEKEENEAGATASLAHPADPSRQSASTAEHQDHAATIETTTPSAALIARETPGHESSENTVATTTTTNTRGAVHNTTTGSSKIAPQSLTDEARAPSKNIEESTVPSLEGQQIHLVMST
ncbi:E3 ubiquitin-protein ligase RHF2A [Selaginella moellendorffii]|uniref:E3 ubiquitin-protein ligase RHF2A n=1 Tax=Selaginella moellendorffii TaxID=88036 RepID=UPI000D1C4489|nr:E3 ubiquitin-protein ligase RHF2A [Selaginella moellendorffii]|eukprot:XP_002976125.2 E3 ubiquitin-protein ligase RHF2A [Selaginella moellendorffii]